jgi:hypothetical protein
MNFYTNTFKLIALLVIISNTVLFGKNEIPDWVSNFGESKDFPSEFYLTGFGSAAGDNQDAVQIAEDNARSNLAKSITVHIKSLLSTTVEEKNKKYSEYYSSVIQSSTSMQLSGLQILKHVEKKSRNPQTYAFAYIRKAKLVEIYSQKQAELIDRINSSIVAAEKCGVKEKGLAVSHYLNSMPLFEELKEVETVLMVAGRYGTGTSMFDELEKERKGQKKPSQSKVKLNGEGISQRIDSLMVQSIVTIEDVAKALVYKLDQQLPKNRLPILITPFTYRDTRMTSTFGRYFLTLLETEFPQTPQKQNTVRTRGIIKPQTAVIIREQAKVSGADWVLNGSCWDEPGQIKVLATVREAVSGKIIAGAQVLFCDTLLGSTKLSIKPQDFETAMIEQQAFAKGEILSSKLQIGAWTDRGDQNLLYTKGESMKVFVRVNRPAHVRILYKLADNRYVLLYDDYYIDETKVNQVVEIPEAFECDTPFGVERLTVIARNVKYNKLQIAEKDGYKFIEVQESDNTEKAAEEVGVKVRGMKVKQKENVEIEQNETSLLVTTMED